MAVSDADPVICSLVDVVFDVPFARCAGVGEHRAPPPIGVLKRSARKRPKLTPVHRLFWAFLSQIWGDGRSPLDIVKLTTAIAWHRKGFHLFWTWKIRHGRKGRPGVSCEVRDLIRRISRENPLWGAPHIHRELLKLGIEISETSVAVKLPRAGLARVVAKSPGLRIKPARPGSIATSPTIETWATQNVRRVDLGQQKHNTLDHY